MVQKKIKPVIWSLAAEKHYYEIMEDLTERAPEAVDKVGNALMDMTVSLATDYDHYPPDRFKKGNNGTYKASVVFSYRISYRITEAHIRILRIRHTSREPLGY
jgi:plasmid stabilization system protein ParE